MSLFRRALDVPAIVPATTTVCAVELATLSASLRNGLGIGEIALLFACFHLGYLAADPLRRRVAVGTSAMAIVTVAVAGALCLLAEGAWVAVTGGFLLAFNAVAQAARRSLKDQGTIRSITKNVGKAMGMVLGGVVGSFQFGPVLLVPFALHLALRRTAGSKLAADGGLEALTRRDRALLWGEFLHHMHYFVYCYGFWYLAPTLISPAIGAWFLVGWLAYFATELLWRETRRAFAPKVIASGHLIVALALLGMPNLDTAGLMAAWFATGVGGGTAYMLGNSGGRGPRERFEDWGHVGGVLVAAAISTTANTRHDAATACVLAGAFLALVTAMMFMVIAPQAQERETTRIGESDASRRSRG